MRQYVTPPTVSPPPICSIVHCSLPHISVLYFVASFMNLGVMTSSQFNWGLETAGFLMIQVAVGVEAVCAKCSRIPRHQRGSRPFDKRRFGCSDTLDVSLRSGRDVAEAPSCPRFWSNHVIAFSIEGVNNKIAE